MTRIVYVNGAYVPESEATVSVFDRGFLFADAVYEVTAVVDGRLVDFALHTQRLRRSLGEIEIENPLSDEALGAMHEELIQRNGLREGIVYMEISRGAADRDFVYPQGVRPTVIAFTQPKALIDNPAAESGIAVITVPDIRWQRCDIKTVSLLPAAMAKQAAKLKGAQEAWLVTEGTVTEGASSSAFIVADGNVVITRPLGYDILPGVTRRSVIELAKSADVTLEERPFSVEEARRAREAFITSASSFVLPVVKIDDTVVGDGRPGAITRRLRDIYINEARKG